MKIGHIVRQFHPGVGGLEEYVKALAAHQAKTGVDVEVLTLNRVYKDRNTTLPDYCEILGVKVRRFSYLGSDRYPVSVSMIKYLLSNEYDCLHIHGVDFFIDSISFLSRFKKIKFILSTHGGFFHTSDYALFKKIYFHTITRFSLGRAQVVCACSINDFDIFYKICPRKIKLLNNAIDYEGFSAGFDAASKRMTKTFIFVGRLAKNKKVFSLINTFSELVKFDESVLLHIVGKPWDIDAEILNKYIVDSGLADNVKYHGEISTESLKKLMNESSFCVSASAYEGFGMTIVEGMAAGLIPVVSNIPSFNNIVYESNVGKVVDFDDSVSAADDILQLIESYQDSYNLEVINSNKYASLFNWSNLSNKFVNIYESI